MTLLERLRVVAASLRDFDHADDHIEVDTRAVSALLTEAANSIEATTKERDYARESLASCDATRMRNAEHYRDALNGLTTRERELAEAIAEIERLRGWREECDGMMVAINRLTDDVDRLMRERDAAIAEVARLLRLTTGPHINEEGVMRCGVCRRRCDGMLCRDCSRSFDRANVDGTIYSVMVWAANRSRHMERARRAAKGGE